MRNVIVTMQDQFTRKEVVRTIDALNAYSSGDVCWELRGEAEQRKNLNRWIIERANEQHETILELVSWRFEKN